ncbi:MAG: MCP four helix bundle domain-containing protein, partial [Pseudomonas sp.]|uniref:MCP four helix bundle domain-containing protein n=2 Tax=Pseudomonas TaxID=286 RepID=UPI00391B71A8
MKNWTLRQRILASFAVIIAIMLLMVVVSYSRLMKIESSQEAVRDDAVPGVYLSSMIRSAWVDSYLMTIDIIGLRDEKTFTGSDRADYNSFEARIEQQMANYEHTVHNQADRMEFDNFKAAHLTYNKVLKQVIERIEADDLAAARQLLEEQLTPIWVEGRMKLNDIITENKAVSDNATAAIDEAVSSAKISMFVSLAVAILAAGLCGLLLMRTIMAPMQRIVEILDIMRTGDLSKRLNLARKDEFNAVETGFNDMMTELTALVSQAQRSSVQVTTSVTEIAATSKQQQATATETAATTTEIGATSREIAATSKDLVRTMTEVSTAADQASVAAGSGQQGLARMEETMHSVMGAADLVNAKL